MVEINIKDIDEVDLEIAIAKQRALCQSIIKYKFKTQFVGETHRQSNDILIIIIHKDINKVLVEKRKTLDFTELSRMTTSDYDYIESAYEDMRVRYFEGINDELIKYCEEHLENDWIAITDSNNCNNKEILKLDDIYTSGIFDDILDTTGNT